MRPDVAAIVGRRIASAIGDLLRLDACGDAGVGIDDVVRRHASDLTPLWLRLAVEQSMTMSIVSYLAFHRLPSPWRLVGAEVRLGRARFDLMWRSDHSGCVCVDELKSRTDPTCLAPRTRAQCLMYLVEGRAAFGDRFVGVRLISLADHRDAKLVRCASDLVLTGS